MKKEQKEPAHPVVENVRKILNDKGFTQAYIADEMGLSQPQFSRLLHGQGNFSVLQLAKFASIVGMDIIDVFTYPDVYVKQEPRSEEEITASITIRVSDPKKAELLKLVLGEKSLRLLSKDN